MSDTCICLPLIATIYARDLQAGTWTATFLKNHNVPVRIDEGHANTAVANRLAVARARGDALEWNFDIARDVTCYKSHFRLRLIRFGSYSTAEPIDLNVRDPLLLIVICGICGNTACTLSAVYLSFANKIFQDQVTMLSATYGEAWPDLDRGINIFQ